MDPSEVLRLEDEAHTQLMEAVDAVPAERRMVEGVVPNWSTHDVLWHVTYWVGRAVQVLQQAQLGPPYPDEPEDGAYYDAENDAAFAPGRAMTWDAVTDRFTMNREQMRSVLESSNGVASGWIAERAMEEVEHYRLHAAQLGTFTEAS